MFCNGGVKIHELVEVCIGVFIFENQTKQNLAMAHQSTLCFNCILDFNMKECETIRRRVFRLQVVR